MIIDFESTEIQATNIANAKSKYYCDPRAATHERRPEIARGHSISLVQLNLFVQTMVKQPTCNLFIGGQSGSSLFR